MENKWDFIGIDVSKLTLDVHSFTLDKHLKVKNNQNGIAKMLGWLSKCKVDTSRLWFVFETTGMYSVLLTKEFSAKRIKFSEVSGIAIKRSLGLVRGKSDRIDAKRISLYGVEKQLSLNPSPAYNEKLTRLKALMNTRDKFVAERAGHQATTKEYICTGVIGSDDPLIIARQEVIRVLDQSIRKVEKQVRALIEEDEELKRNYNLIMSVKGIGFVTAAYTILFTANFTRFNDPRKFACYCGTAPFEKSSGTSIKGRTGVSHLANKKMKSLLTQAAKSARLADPELKQFYERRLAMGKSKMSSINILRNKLIQRMFAVVKNSKPYEIKIAA